MTGSARSRAQQHRGRLGSCAGHAPLVSPQRKRPPVLPPPGGGSCAECFVQHPSSAGCDTWMPPQVAAGCWASQPATSNVAIPRAQLAGPRLLVRRASDASMSRRCEADRHQAPGWPCWPCAPPPPAGCHACSGSSATRRLLCMHTPRAGAGGCLDARPPALLRCKGRCVEQPRSFREGERRRPEKAVLLGRGTAAPPAAASEAGIIQATPQHSSGLGGSEQGKSGASYHIMPQALRLLLAAEGPGSALPAPPPCHLASKSSNVR